MALFVYATKALIEKNPISLANDKLSEDLVAADHLSLQRLYLSNTQLFAQKQRKELLCESLLPSSNSAELSSSGVRLTNKLQAAPFLNSVA
jgi:hypothetical protein